MVLVATMMQRLYVRLAPRSNTAAPHKSRLLRDNHFSKGEGDFDPSTSEHATI